jgi:ammonia channel protein AmtB
MPTTLSGITFNFILSFSGGLLSMYLVSRGNPFWTYSGGLCGIISASAGNDLYHPVMAFAVGGLGSATAYYFNNMLERRFKIDDPVGAVAVHGYGGVFGTVVAGFLLWGYPAAAPATGSGAPWFATAEGWPMVNPLGNIIGAIIMFWVLGFVPCYLVARLLKMFNLLRVPREVELAGFDTFKYGDPYPYFPHRDTEFDAVERDDANQKR